MVRRLHCKQFPAGKRYLAQNPLFDSFLTALLVTARSEVFEIHARSIGRAFERRARSGTVESIDLHVLVLEQFDLHVDTTAKTCEAAVCPNNAMARHDQA